jgi:hypothetical protein
MHVLRVSVLTITVAAGVLAIANLGVKAQRDARIAADFAKGTALQKRIVQVRQDAGTATLRLQTLVKELDALDEQVASAVTALGEAQDTDERQTCRLRLQGLQRRQFETKDRASRAHAAARDATAKLERGCLGCH